MPNFPRKAAHLKKLLKMGALTKLDLNEEERAVVDEQKRNLKGPSVRGTPLKDQPSAKETEACKK